MERLVEFDLEQGGSLIVEVNDPITEGGIVPAADVGKAVSKASKTFEDALGKIKIISSELLTQIRDISESPDEATVEFGIKVGAEAGVILASGTVEANFAITLKWSKQK